MGDWYTLAAAVVAPILAAGVTGHAVLTKRDARSALMWVALAWLVPLLGALLYVVFGINRINRRASALNRVAIGAFERRWEYAPEHLGALLGEGGAHLGALGRANGRITPRPLVRGNRITPLDNGDEAYPAMLAAIDGARESIALATYIFGNDHVGHAFADALERAVARGVAVRVLIDTAGERYTWPSMVGELRARRVPVARFLPAFPARLVGVNLRNHRKLLVVDGRIGFTGGMNIRRHHEMRSGHRATRDLQFRVEGPVVRHLQEVFWEDWLFAAGERLDAPAWFPRLEPAAGGVVARGIPDGPDDDFMRHQMTLEAAVASARHSIRIVTPYFLPDAALISALNIASARGVAVDIILPAHSNLPFIQWAVMGQLPQVLALDCRVWLSPPPFDHAKLMVVDDAWVFLGSSNWDPRSLRLNFEFNLECFDRPLARDVAARINARRAAARRLTRADLAERGLPRRLRDGLARLAAPYL